MSGYCLILYRQLGTYEAVARRTRLDRRTVKKYITMYHISETGKMALADDHVRRT